MEDDIEPTTAQPDESGFALHSFDRLDVSSHLIMPTCLADKSAFLIILPQEPAMLQCKACC